MSLFQFYQTHRFYFENPILFASIIKATPNTLDHWLKELSTTDAEILYQLANDELKTPTLTQKDSESLAKIQKIFNSQATLKTCFKSHTFYALVESSINTRDLARYLLTLTPQKIRLFFREFNQTHFTLTVQNYLKNFSEIGYANFGKQQENTPKPTIYNQNKKTPSTFIEKNHDTFTLRLARLIDDGNLESLFHLLPHTFMIEMLNTLNTPWRPNFTLNSASIHHQQSEPYDTSTYKQLS